MSYRSRTYRHRNAHGHDDMQQPFFPKENDINKTKQQNSFFQAKLAINKPGDQYEKEADSVANAVINRSSGKPVLQQKKVSSIQRLSTSAEEEKLGTNDARMKMDKDIQEMPIQRMTPDPEKEKMKGIQKMDMPKKEEEKVQKMDKPKKEEEKVQKMDMPKKEEEKNKSAVQTKHESSASSASPQTSSRIIDSAGKGSSLPATTLKEMNTSFGTDFSQVQIHKDSEAVKMNQDLRSQAFTHGKDIYFNEGKFDPNSASGKFLLAHELTHVIQQNGNPNSIQRTVTPARVSCNAYPRSYPIFTTMGTNDPVGVLTAADARAIEILSNTIDELNFVRQSILNGAA